MSNSHATAYYWSHAGQHFEIRDEGDWWVRFNDGALYIYACGLTLGCVHNRLCFTACRWVAVPDDEWPEDVAQRGVVMQVRG